MSAFLEKVNKQKEIQGEAEISLLNCDHTHGTFVKEFYFEGSYNDKAYTDVCTYCNVCGKLLSTNTRNHSRCG